MLLNRLFYPHKWGGVKESIEIVIIDDGSEDKISEKVIELKQKYDCIKFFRFEQNGGVARARNKGVELAKGEWIVLLDSDDKLLECAFEIFEQYIKRYPNLINFAFGGESAKTACTVKCNNGEFLGKDVKDYFDKGNFDGEFLSLTRTDIHREFPFFEGLNGGEGIKWYQQWKKYYDRMLYTEKVVCYINVNNTDSILRQGFTENKIRNAIKICEKRLEIMEEDLKIYQPKGKDGLAMSYAVLGKYYIMLGDRRKGLKFTIKTIKVDFTEKRWLRNILMLIGIIK